MRYPLLFILLFVMYACAADDSAGDNNFNNINNTNNVNNVNNANNANNTNNVNNTNNTNSTTSPPDGAYDAQCADATPDFTTFYMSADDSNSQAQPVWFRTLIAQGYHSRADFEGLPAREYEFLNYYSFRFPDAPPGGLTITPELSYDSAEESYTLLVGLSSYRVSPMGRRPFNLTFSIDSSGSMAGAPIENTKKIIKTITEKLLPGDVISIVDWNFYTHILLFQHMYEGPSDMAVHEALELLSTEGNTNLSRGLAKAYEVANTNYSPSYLNRVILITDGNANVGIVEADLIGSQAQKEEGDGIFLIGVGTSMLYDHQFMDTVTDLGKGAYLYIPDEAEAERMFGPERIYSNTEIAALDVRMELTLPPHVVLQRFYGEQVSTTPSDVRPQHLAPNDAMLYHSVLKNCSGQPLVDQELGFRASWISPFSGEPREVLLTTTFGDLLGQQPRNLTKASYIVEYARLLVNADRLTTSQQEAARVDLINNLTLLNDDSPDPDLIEIISVLENF